MEGMERLEQKDGFQNDDRDGRVLTISRKLQLLPF